MPRHLVVISYDLADDRLRTRLSNLLSSYGRRVQYSVFECWLDDAELAELCRRAAEYISAEGDSMRCYRLCGVCAGQVKVVGAAEPPEEPPEYWIV